MTGVSVSAGAMDRMYRRQRHVYDLSRKYYLLGRDTLIRRVDAQPGHNVLEVGCGTGRNLICAAKRFPRSAFYGIDISREMLASAEAAIRRSGLSERVHVAFADANRFDEPSAMRTYDRIFISYTLSMIPEWRSVVRNVLTMLAPGGQLHIVDFGGQEGLPTWFRKGLRHWLGMFGVVPCDDLESELRHLTGARWTLHRLYRGYAQYAVIERILFNQAANIALLALWPDPRAL